jgi:hypothetical protein
MASPAENLLEKNLNAVKRSLAIAIQHLRLAMGSLVVSG